MSAIPGWLPELLIAIVASVLAITLHEAAHGYAALALGDDTARRMGRLSLNPLRHVDRVGTILVPGFLLLTQLLTVGRVEFMFGWAKPVPVDVRGMRHPLQAMMIVAAAGPAMNFLLAWLGGLAINLGVAAGVITSFESPSIGVFLARFILANLVLGLFNLLPLPPLDGGRIVAGLLPRSLAVPYLRLERYGILLVLFAVFLLPRLTGGFDPINWGLRHVVANAFDWVLLLSGNGPGA